MKRSAPPLVGSERTPSQQPFPCRLCRSRKLKCDRGHPCFNCSSRNFECVFDSDHRQSSMPPIHTSGTGVQIQHVCEKDCESLSQRIQRLESAVFRSEESEATQYGPLSSSLNASTKTSESNLHNQDEEQQKTSEWLKGFLMETNNSDASKVAATSSETVRSDTVNKSIILHEFPTYGDAIVLLSHHINTVNAIYRILHVPTTWQWLDELYADLNAKRPYSPTQLAFFLGIFAGSAYISKKEFQFNSANLYGRSQIRLAESWFKQAVFFLTKPAVPASTQALQAFTNLAHLCTQIEGLTGSFAVLSMSGLQMAKSMRIHQLDSPRYRGQRRENGANMVDLEVKRRVWWHLVSSDWLVLCNTYRLLSNSSGPNEGTYMLHPRHMETFHPSNVDDEDIPKGITHVSEESYCSPLTSSTSMSYFLCRIQYATLARETTDRLPPSFLASPGMDSGDKIYDNIILLDQKYQQFLKALPPFFQLTVRQDTNSYGALIKEKPYLEWQRYLVNFVIHTHLSRLHRPFLIRGSTQHKFAYSRMQCIRSAETVLEIWNLIGDQSIGGFTYILMHFLTAAIILAMDVCFNPDEVRVSQRKEDVLRACRKLEEELNAKLVPTNAAGNEGYSNGQAMLKSFRKAVQNLRALLKKKPNKDKLQLLNRVSADNGTDNLTTKAPVVWGNRRARRAHLQGMNRNSSAESSNEIIDNQLQATSYEHPNHTIPYDKTAGGLNGLPQTPILTPQPTDNGSRSPREAIQGPGELIVDELWDEFFAVGSTFEDADWDAFLIDFDEQIGGIE